MKYPYEELGHTRFEELVVALCRRLLGMATQGFATGPDGGRDAKFVGTAEMLPSRRDPWTGTVIVQAKHTLGYNFSFTDTDFFNPESANAVISKEVLRIKELRNAGQLDHYILFSNRNLPGRGESAIRAYISKECDIPESSILLCGIEQLEGWLKDFPEVPTQLNFDPIDSPLSVGPDELSEVVQALAHHLKGGSVSEGSAPTPRTPYEEKNRINGMTADYAKELRTRYLKESAQIATFLAAPENDDLQQKYNSAIEDFQLSIVAKRKDYQTFDEVMVYLSNLLIDRDQSLRSNKRLTRAILFYMYWNCDIGKDSDAQAN